MSDAIMNIADLIRLETNRLNSLARNAANTATPGYRAEQQVIKLSEFNNVLSAQNAVAEKHFSTRDAGLQLTGVYSHLALQGNGWFVLQGANGPVLTRDGRFVINANRTLVSQATGLPLLDKSANVIQVDGPFSVASGGAVYQQGAQIAEIQIATADASQLEQDQNGHFKAQQIAAADTGFTITQGALERSNVDTAADMVTLMTITRHIESMQRSLNAYDQLLNTGINQIGK